MEALAALTAVGPVLGVATLFVGIIVDKRRAARDRRPYDWARGR